MKIVLWDIDGTLLRTAGAGGKSMFSALESLFGCGPPRDAKITFAGRTDRAIINDLLRHGGVDATEENVAKLIECYLHNLPAQLGQPGTGPLPGIVEAVEYLKQHKSAVQGLLTGNLKRGAYAKLKAYNLDHYFPFGGFGDDYYDRDDVAREALRALRDFGVGTTDHVWVLGDTPNDIKCARAVGAKVIAVATGTYAANELAEYEPDELFEDFSDVGALFKVMAV